MRNCEPALGGDRRDVIDDLLGTLRPAELLGVGLDDRAGLARRCGGVELERPEDDVDVDLVVEFGDRRLEATLADVAPRADDVGPDLDRDTRADVGAHKAMIGPYRGDHDHRAAGRAGHVLRHAGRPVGAARPAPRGRRAGLAQHADGVGARRPIRHRPARLPRRAFGRVRRARRSRWAAGTPAALLCTSGTAATHFHAAVVEAHQSGVPMLVLTADRPPELHGVGAPQTIEQNNLYGDAVRWFHDPGVAVDEQRTTWRSLASTAWARATGDRPGPGAPQPAVPRAVGRGRRRAARHRPCSSCSRRHCSSSTTWSICSVRPAG